MLCYLKVDLEYPRELHDLHNDYQLAPERITLDGAEKLVPTLGSKKRYVLHHEVLKKYLELGLKLTHIHRGIKFKESAWMRSYIKLNTGLRMKAAEAESKFGKSFYKLMINSVFGKTMENDRKGPTSSW